MSTSSPAQTGANTNTTTQSSPATNTPTEQVKTQARRCRLSCAGHIGGQPREPVVAEEDDAAQKRISVVSRHFRQRDASLREQLGGGLAEAVVVVLGCFSVHPHWHVKVLAVTVLGLGAVLCVINWS
jgi:hypothetical protein